MLTYQDIYNLQIGDVISFPADIDDVPIIEVPGYQFLWVATKMVTLIGFLLSTCVDT